MPFMMCLRLCLLSFLVSVAFGDSVPTSRPKAVPPWGELEIQRIPLEKSDQVFLDRAERLKKPAWHFENMSPPQLLAFFESCNLGPFARAELFNTNQWQVQSNACVIFPSDELILKLTPAERQRLYDALSRSESNYAQRWPFRIPLNGFNERFASSGLSSEKLALIRSLTYTNGNQLCFCSFATLQKQLGEQEFQAVVEALYAIPAVQVRLHVQHGADVNGLVEYWGRGGRAKRIRPLLESLAKIPGGGAINISFLLPSFARTRLYVYPDPDSDVAEAKTDCFYTALNFFNDRPDARLLDQAIKRTALQTDYAPLAGQPPTFGDLITLLNRKGDAFHIAVQIAQDIVFTKNGENYLQPWVLMKMDDMLAYYGAEEPIRIVIFRRKNL